MIPDACIKRIEHIAKMENITLGFVEMFQAASNEAAVLEKPSVTIVVPLYDEECKLQTGDYAPELHFVVRKVE